MSSKYQDETVSPCKSSILWVSLKQIYENSICYVLYIYFYFQADYESDVVLRARKLDRDSDVYLNFEKMKVKIKIGRAQLHLSNLFGGDNVLGKPIVALDTLLNNLF